MVDDAIHRHALVRKGLAHTALALLPLEHRRLELGHGRRLAPATRHRSPGRPLTMNGRSPGLTSPSRRASRSSVRGFFSAVRARPQALVLGLQRADLAPARLRLAVGVEEGDRRPDVEGHDAEQDHQQRDAPDAVPADRPAATRDDAWPLSRPSFRGGTGARVRRGLAGWGHLEARSPRARAFLLESAHRPISARTATTGRRSDPGRSRRRPAPLRCAAAGCTSPRDRSVRARRS